MKILIYRGSVTLQRREMRFFFTSALAPEPVAPHRRAPQIREFFGTAEAVPFHNGQSTSIRQPCFPLRVEAALANVIGHAVNGQHVGRDAVIHAMSFGVADHIFERRPHDVFQLLVHR